VTPQTLVISMGAKIVAHHPLSVGEQSHEERVTRIQARSVLTEKGLHCLAATEHCRPPVALTSEMVQ
jgi:hypothetical protein